MKASVLRLPIGILFTAILLSFACKKDKILCCDNMPTLCDSTRLPVVFVHGFLASGDTWTSQIQRFEANNLCAGRLFAFDWNTLSPANADQVLDRFIDSVLEVTGATKVHLVGHSAGGGRGYSYLSSDLRAAKVSHYAHIGSSPESGPAGPGGSVPTINIYSTADAIVSGNDIPGAENVRFTEYDHYEVATSAATFVELYRFFYGVDPEITTLVPLDIIRVSGKCITLGENQPTAGAEIEVFEADNLGNPGALIGTYGVNTSGYWGPFEGRGNQRYLFKVSHPNPDFRKVIYYYEAFERNNQTVYLRTFPPSNSFAGLLLASIPNNDNQGVISLFSSSKAVLHGRDLLSLDGIDLATPGLANESATMIALFCYDHQNDGQGNGEPIPTFSLFPFLQGADIPIATQPVKTWIAEFNGRIVPVRNWRSKSDGVVIVVFK